MRELLRSVHYRFVYHLLVEEGSRAVRLALQLTKVQTGEQNDTSEFHTEAEETIRIPILARTLSRVLGVSHP